MADLAQKQIMIWKLAGKATQHIASALNITAHIKFRSIAKNVAELLCTLCTYFGQN